MTSTDRLNEYAQPSEMRMAKGVDGGMGREDSFFGPWKLITIGFMLALIGVSIAMWVIHGFTTGIIWLACSLLLNFFLTRFVVLEEKKYEKLFDTCHFEEPQSVEIFDNVMRLSGDNKDSISSVYLGTGETSLVLQVQHGSIVGKGINYTEVYYDTLSDALRMLVKNDYVVIRKQMMVNCRDDPRLSALKKKEVKLDNKSLKDLMRDELGYLVSISGEVQYEQEYWFIYTKKLASEEVFMGDVARALTLIRTVANRSHLCTKGELYVLDQDEFGCPNAALGEKHSATGMDLKELGRLGIYVSAIDLGEYTLQEASLQGYYGGSEDKYTNLKTTPDALQVTGMLKELEGRLEGREVLDLKEILYAKYIVNSSVYKQALADSLANMDWSDEDDE